MRDVLMDQINHGSALKAIMRDQAPPVMVTLTGLVAMLEETNKDLYALRGSAYALRHFMSGEPPGQAKGTLANPTPPSGPPEAITTKLSTQIQELRLTMHEIHRVMEDVQSHC